MLQIQAIMHKTAGEALLTAEVNGTVAVMVAGRILTTTKEGLKRLSERGVEYAYLMWRDSTDHLRTGKRQLCTMMSPVAVPIESRERETLAREYWH